MQLLVRCPVWSGHCLNCDKRTELHVPVDGVRCSGVHVCSEECYAAMSEMIPLMLAHVKEMNEERAKREAKERLEAFLDGVSSPEGPSDRRKTPSPLRR
jgi:hypothetical protein